ncbi:MAG: hypothetical protein ACU83N_05730 [Gammaproteobacteria bacterium]
MNKIENSINFGYFLVALCLPLVSVFFLYLESITHYEFLLHVAAIPLEVLVGAVLVERYLARRERGRRARQLMFIKSCLFRSELRSLYLTNFQALEYPDIGMEDIKTASSEELAIWLTRVDKARYRSPEAMEAVIMEYVKAYQAFYGFLEWAIANDFEMIFHDMIMLMHFIHDAKLFKRLNPNKMFISKAEEDDELMARVESVLTGGIKSFLKFSIELKENRPDVFRTLIEDYQYPDPLQTISPTFKPTDRLSFKLDGD